MYFGWLYASMCILFSGNEINLLVDVVLMAAKQKQRYRTLFKHERTHIKKEISSFHSLFTASNTQSNF